MLANFKHILTLMKSNSNTSQATKECAYCAYGYLVDTMNQKILNQKSIPMQQYKTDYGICMNLLNMNMQYAMCDFPTIVICTENESECKKCPFTSVRQIQA